MQVVESLLHFSREPLHIIHDCECPPGSTFKPEGIWLSAGMEWLTWCMANDFHLDDIRHVTRVVLHPEANVVRLATYQQIQMFTSRYGVNIMPDHPELTQRYIDWPRVQAEYDGMVLSPYIGRARFDLRMMWYYAWDVASACIWKARAVESIGPSLATDFIGHMYPPNYD